MGRQIGVALIFLVLLVCYPHIGSYAQSSEEIRNQLMKKGVTEEIIKLLTLKSQESLNRRLPDGVIWYATFDRYAKSITIDYQATNKTHNSITVVSLKDGGCMTVQNTVIMTQESCKVEAERWIASYKKRGIKVKKEEESQQRIYLSTEGNVAAKIYLYPMGNLCMQVFRTLETIK